MKKNAFTFIELLVVITIMAVIFAAGIVSYTTISQNSRDARRRADLEAIRQALEMCRSIAGSYPDNIYPTSNSIVCGDANGTVTLKVTPVDPRPDTSITNCPADGKYTYIFLEPTGEYTLTAYCMEDKTKTYQVTNP